jgi:hypothetical protein
LFFFREFTVATRVGTSTNGAGALSLNMLTDSYSKESNGEISNSLGVLIPENIPLSLVRV